MLSFLLRSFNIFFPISPPSTDIIDGGYVLKNNFLGCFQVFIKIYIWAFIFTYNVQYVGHFKLSFSPSRSAAFWRPTGHFKAFIFKDLFKSPPPPRGGDGIRLLLCHLKGFYKCWSCLLHFKNIYGHNRPLPPK
jgi:hypothetical protein